MMEENLMQIVYLWEYPDNRLDSTLESYRLDASSAEDAVEKAIPLIREELSQLREEVAFSAGASENDIPSAFRILLVRDLLTGILTVVDKVVEP